MDRRGPAAGRAGSVRGVFREFWPYTRGDRLRLLAGGLLSLVLLGCEVASVVIFEAIVGKVLESRHLAGFWLLAGLWLAAAALGALAMAWGGWLSGLAAQRVQLRLRDSVFAHTQRLPVDYFDERRLGDLMVRLTDDIAVVEGAVASGPVSLGTSVISIVVFAVAALVIRWDLALMAFAVAPAFWVVARLFSGPLSQAASRERTASGSVTSAVEESLANQALIQAFNRQEVESRRLHREGVWWLRAKMAETRLDSIYAPLVYFLETCCVLAVFGLGAWDVAGGRLSLAGLLAFAACLAYLYPPVQGLSGLVLTVSEAAASAARIDDILSFRPQVAERTLALKGRLRGRGRIDFEDVTFSYPRSGRPVLDRLSFTAVPGRLLAIAGPSGTGKSTITRLLLRFYDPDAGPIRLDDIDIRDLSLRTLRYNVTLLQQETLQRQRISIARAFLRDAPVLILDEPSTGLDAASADRLLTVIRRFAAGHTAIVITHDPRVTAVADDVLRLSGPAAVSYAGHVPR